MVKRAAETGVQRAYAILFAYVIAMIEEVGTERAFKILSDVVNKLGEADGRELLKTMKIKRNDLDSGFAVYSAFLTDGGIDHSVAEKTGEKISVRIGQCPIYNAYYDTGLACDWLVEAMCHHIALPLVNSVLRQVDPKLKVTVKRYRSSRDDFCTEELSVCG